MLLMAFAPDYATTGRFYVSYNDGAACHPNCDIAGPMTIAPIPPRIAGC